MEGYEWLRKRFSDEKAKNDIQKVIQLTDVAKELGCTTAQLALAWCTVNPHVSTVITGASKESQVDAHLHALQVAELLTPDVVGRIEEILANKPDLPSDMR